MQTVGSGALPSFARMDILVANGYLQVHKILDKTMTVYEITIVNLKDNNYIFYNICKCLIL